MKIIFIAFLFCFSFVSVNFSQDKSPKKSDNKNVSKPIVITANVAVVNADGALSDDVKPEEIKVFEDGVEQKITYITKKEPILNLGLVFDNSGSMRKNLDKLSKINSAFTDTLVSGNEAFIVRFVDSETVEIIQDWTSNKNDLNEALDSMFVQGGESAVLDAVYLSAEKILERERQNKSKRYAIVLISDAEDRDSYYDFDETMFIFKDSDLQIFLLSFAENAPLKKKKARSLGNSLTLETGGTIYSLPKKHNSEDIINAVKNIAGELRSQFIIKYTSTNQMRDGLPRKLTVTVSDGAKGEKRQGIIREGFTIPKE